MVLENDERWILNMDKSAASFYENTYLLLLHWPPPPPHLKIIERLFHNRTVGRSFAED